MKVEAQKQHQWLQKMVGEWMYEGEANMGPDQPPHKFGGSESVRALGNLWVVGDLTSEVSEGEQMKAVIQLGYDPQKARFVGTFASSMGANLWVYEGEQDASGNKLTLNAEGPNMSPGAPEGKTTQYQDIIEYLSDDERTLTSLMQMEDGSWQQIMRSHYRRQK